MGVRMVSVWWIRKLTLSTVEIAINLYILFFFFALVLSSSVKESCLTVTKFKVAYSGRSLR